MGQLVHKTGFVQTGNVGTVSKKGPCWAEKFMAIEEYIVNTKSEFTL